MSEEDFHKAVLPFIQQTVKSENADTALIAKCLHQRTEVLGEIGAQIDFIDVLDDYSPDLFINKKSKSTLESSKTMLEAVIPALEALPEWSQGPLSLTFLPRADTVRTTDFQHTKKTQTRLFRHGLCLLLFTRNQL